MMKPANHPDVVVQPPRPARPRRGAGFTLVELLLSVMLVGLLLSAVAVATHSSFHSYEENAEISSLTQTARALAGRIRRDIRTAEAVKSDGPANQLVLTPPAQPGGPDEITYELDPNGTFFYRTKVGAATTSSAVLKSTSPVTLLSFAPKYDIQQDANSVSYTRRVMLHLDFAMDNQTFSANCSAAVRRNQQY